jgi:fused signal recognition particle receptor
MKLFKNINFDKLKNGLSKTREKIVTGISEALSGKAALDDATVEELEEILLTSDIGFETAETILDNTKITLKKESDRTNTNILNVIKNELSKWLLQYSDDKNEFANIESHKPYVILIVGVNGSGKTTTVGKLAYNYKKAGYNVLIGSADTFRAAANEQLEIWAQRAGVDIIQSKSGTDPSAIAFDTMKAAEKCGADIVLIDTAGRLHTKNNLMLELKKIKRVIGNVLPYAPNEVFLVVDASTGQNAIQQANEFKKYTELTGLIITKLDGTAKGGSVFQICSEQQIPIRYIGVGEKIDDLQTFDAKEFVEALFGN